MDPEQVVSTLNELIEVSKEGEYGFRLCAEKSNSPSLTEIFSRRAEECREAASELQQCVVEWGEAPVKTGTAAGSLQRGWMSMRSASTAWDDRSLLEVCERGEDSAMDTYLKALDGPLPVMLRPVIDRQYIGAVHNQSQLRELRNSVH